jgi:hypothetical protein
MDIQDQVERGSDQEDANEGDELFGDEPAVREKLEKLRQKIEQLTSQKEAVEKRDLERRRRRLTRRKILIGACVVDRMKRDAEFKAQVLADLATYLTRKDDRRLFGLAALAESEQPRDNLEKGNTDAGARNKRRTKSDSPKNVEAGSPEDATFKPVLQQAGHPTPAIEKRDGRDSDPKPNAMAVAG